MILSLDPITGTLRSYHIGNSVYAVINEELKSTKIQSLYHYDELPEVPYLIKKRIINNKFLSSENQFGDLKDGIYNQMAFCELSNSLIVVGSDGLWENFDIEHI